MKQECNSSALMAEWAEREEHERIMDALSKVVGEVGFYFFINGNYFYWKINELPKGEPERIAERGNHEEILYMIHQYGKTRCYHERYLHDQAWSHGGNEGGALLSDKVQEIILKRNISSEINAYTLYHGFAPAGQNIILQRGNHEEIMTYLQRHGFAAEQQFLLWKRGNNEEIELHIKNHGCSDRILDAIFNDLSKGITAPFLHYISVCELPVPYQIRMVQTVDHELFMAYINRYGLWNDAHADLVRERTVDELMAYIDKHRFLSNVGQNQLAFRHVTRLTQYYIEKRVNHKNVDLFYGLVKAQPIDNEALALFFLKLDYSDDNRTTDEELELIKNGSNEEVLAYISKNVLGIKALAILFLRESKDEFLAYLKKWCY